MAREVRDIECLPEGTGRALIRRGKTDADGHGRVAYLSREMVKWLKIWLDHAKISGGAIFRQLIGAEQIGGALKSRQHRARLQAGDTVDRDVGEICYRRERALDMGRASQDLAALDIDLAAIMQAGGWKSTRMPLQYAERIKAARSGRTDIRVAMSNCGASRRFDEWAYALDTVSRPRRTRDRVGLVGFTEGVGRWINGNGGYL